MRKFTITVKNSDPREGEREYTEFTTESFLLLVDDPLADSIAVLGEVDRDFIQDLLIISPIERFAEQYEKAYGRDKN